MIAISMATWSAAALALGGLAAAVAFAFYIQRKLWLAQRLSEEARQLMANARRDVEIEKRDITLKLKDELHKKRQEFDSRARTRTPRT